MDTQAKELLRQQAVTGSNEQGYTLVDGIIKHHGRIWIGANAGLQTKLIHALHASLMGGHSGSQATYQRVKKVFTWKGLKQDIEEFVKQRMVC